MLVCRLGLRAGTHSQFLLQKGRTGVIDAQGEGTLFVLTLPLQAGNRVINSPIPLRLKPKEAPRATQD